MSTKSPPVTEKNLEPRWTRLERDERRSQIVAAARALLGERHWASISTQDVADAAGVTRGLLHHYFRTKHDLYLEVAREMLRVPPLPVAVMEAGAPPEQLWACSVRGWLDLMEANRESWLAAVRAGEIGDDPELRQIVDDASEQVVDRVFEALGMHRDDTPPSLRALVRAYGGLAQEATREWLERGRLNRAQVELLLVGAMPLIVEHLVPDILRASDGAPRRARGTRTRRR